MYIIDPVYYYGCAVLGFDFVTQVILDAMLLESAWKIWEDFFPLADGLRERRLALQSLAGAGSQCPGVAGIFVGFNWG